MPYRVINSVVAISPANLFAFGHRSPGQILNSVSIAPGPPYRQTWDTPQHLIPLVDVQDQYFEDRALFSASLMQLAQFARK